MTAGRGFDGEEIEAGDTYHSLETISEEGELPEAAAEGELLPARPTGAVPSRAGLPLTEAVGRLVERVDKGEKRIRQLEVALGVTIGVGLGLTVAVFAEATAIARLWFH